ncbi:unnamed protein product [Calypogeia fissa]
MAVFSIAWPLADGNLLPRAEWADKNDALIGLFSGGFIVYYGVASVQTRPLRHRYRYYSEIRYWFAEVYVEIAWQSFPIHGQCLCWVDTNRWALFSGVKIQTKLQI